MIIFRLMISLLIFFCILHCTSSYKFLAYSPLFAKSHINFMAKISDALVEAGHEVVSVEFCNEKEGNPKGNKLNLLRRPVGYMLSMMDGIVHFWYFLIFCETMPNSGHAIRRVRYKIRWFGNRENENYQGSRKNWKMYISKIFQIPQTNKAQELEKMFDKGFGEDTWVDTSIYRFLSVRFLIFHIFPFSHLKCEQGRAK